MREFELKIEERDYDDYYMPWNIKELDELIQSMWDDCDIKVILPNNVRIPKDVFEDLCERLNQSNCNMYLHEINITSLDNEVAINNIINLICYSATYKLMNYIFDKDNIFDSIVGSEWYFSPEGYKSLILGFAKAIQVPFALEKYDKQPLLVKNLKSLLSDFKAKFPNELKQFLLENISYPASEIRVIRNLHIAQLVNNTVPSLDFPVAMSQSQILSEVYHLIMEDYWLLYKIFETLAHYVLSFDSSSTYIKLYEGYLPDQAEDLCDKKNLNKLKALSYVMYAGISLKLVKSFNDGFDGHNPYEIFDINNKGLESCEINNLREVIYQGGYLAQLKRELSDEVFEKYHKRIRKNLITKQINLIKIYLQLILSVSSYNTDGILKSISLNSIGEALLNYLKRAEKDINLIENKAKKSIKPFDTRVKDNDNLALNNLPALYKTILQLNEMLRKNDELKHVAKEWQNESKRYYEELVLFSEGFDSIKQEGEKETVRFNDMRVKKSDVMDYMFDKAKNSLSDENELMQDNENSLNSLIERNNELDQKLNFAQEKNHILEHNWFVNLSFKIDKLRDNLSLSNHLNFNNIFSEACEGVVSKSSENNIKNRCEVCY